jgi:uncharacterized protein YbjT (DUF2867 family)
MNDLTVLHAGATGRYSGLADRLLDRGHRVRALTRDGSSPRARRLGELGAEIAVGDIDDPDALSAAVAGVDVVFFGGTLHAGGPEGDVRHAVEVAEAASRAGAQLVLATVADADPGSHVPILSVKGQVEDRVRAVGVPLTVVAPTYLMENAYTPWHLPHLRERRYPLALPADRSVQQTALADVVGFAAQAIERHDQLRGERIEIASDELTGEEAAEALTRASGAEFEFERLSMDRLPPHLRALFEWLGETGHSVDIDALHGANPDVGWHSFWRWAATQDLGSPGAAAGAAHEARQARAGRRRSQV